VASTICRGGATAQVGVQGDCAMQHRYGLSPSCVLFASYRSCNVVRDLGAVLTIMVQHAETFPRTRFGTPNHSHEPVSARRNIPTSLVRHAETFPRAWFGTPKHSHEFVSVRARRAVRRAEPCVRRAEATQSAETSPTAVSADELETAPKCVTACRIRAEQALRRRTGAETVPLSAEKQRASAPKQPKCPVSARRKSASNH